MVKLNIKSRRRTIERKIKKKYFRKCLWSLWVSRISGKVKHELRVTSSDLRVTSSNLWVASSNPRVTSSNPRVRRLKARVARL